MRWNEIIKGELTESTTLTVLGHNVPNWDTDPDEEMAAMFEDDPMYQPAQVRYKNGKFECWIHSEWHDFFKTSSEAESYLKKWGFTKYVGEDLFGPQTPPELQEDTSGTLFMDVSSLPDWSKENEREVLVFSNGSNQAKVHKDDKGIVVEIDNSWDKSFLNTADAEAWLRDEGYNNFVGVDDL